MNPNLRVVFSVLMLSSLAQGLFAFVTPFYLTSQGINLTEIGIIFSIAASAMVVLKIVLAAYTDVKGRKLLFACSFFLQAVSNAFFPFVSSILFITSLKILYDVGSEVRMSIRSTIIFENARKNYRKIIAWASGLGGLMSAFANFGAAATLSIFDLRGSYSLMTTLLFASFLIVLVAFKEKIKIQKSSKVSLSDVYDLRLSRNMWVIMVAMAFYSIGVRLSHGFAEPLYFQAKYDLGKTEIGFIIGLHRLSLAIPVFFTGTIMHKLDMKKAFSFFTVVLGLSFLGMGIANNVFIAIAIWLTHDIFAGSILVPTTQVLTQLNARDDKRGRDVNTMGLLSGLVGILAPTLTGVLITAQWDLIFTVGGFLILIGSIILYLFYR